MSKVQLKEGKIIKTTTGDYMYLDEGEWYILISLSHGSVIEMTKKSPSWFLKFIGDVIEQVDYKDK